MIARSKGKGLSLLALLLAGCAAGPDFVRPSPETGTVLTADKIETTPLTGDQQWAVGQAVAPDWWTVFGSEHLNAMVKEALGANPNLEAMQAALRRAREQTREAGSALLPSVGASGVASRARDPFGAQGFVGEYGLVNASVGVSFDPDIFGGKHRAREGARASAQARAYELEAARAALAGNVVTAALRQAALAEQLRIANDLVATQLELTRIVAGKVQLGEASATDLAAQQALLARTRAALPPLEKQQAQLRNQLAVYLGRLPSSADLDTFRLAEFHLPETLPVSLPSSLVAQRADVQAAEAWLHAANAQIGVTGAKLLPQFALTAGFGTEAQSFGALFGPGTAAWSLAAGITQLLFDGGARLHERRAAEAGFDESAARYRETVLRAFQDVADVLYAVGKDAEGYAARTDALRAADRSLEVAKRQYGAGLIGHQALLNAETVSAQARIEHVDAELARFADSAALYVALGGGWSTGAEARTGR